MHAHHGVEHEQNGDDVYQRDDHYCIGKDVRVHRTTPPAPDVYHHAKNYRTPCVPFFKNNTWAYFCITGSITAPSLSLKCFILLFSSGLIFAVTLVSLFRNFFAISVSVDFVN
ncbi:hypothetical protein L798_02111 [Zootermopsis nevadensis]|uniref:Uncharacterized protein n=1 Tax=Zootermopsis nevadensis TaxID=136037 RepID=A0A067QHY4_ZOONE|nr:hypothetical protein L798_02111 [Zootermopsis nevadensis]